MEPVHIEEISTAIESEAVTHTRFNVVSHHNTDPHTFFGAITDPGNSVVNIANDSTSWRFVITRMIFNGNGPRPATGSNILSGKKINCIVISGIPFLSKAPSERDRILCTLITVDLGRALATQLGTDIRLHAQVGVGYYLSLRGDAEYDVVKNLTAIMPHNLDYYKRLADKINYSRFTVPPRNFKTLINPDPKAHTLMRMENDISGLKQILNFNESE